MSSLHSSFSRSRLAAAAPDVELVSAEGWIEDLRQTKEPAELERVGSACAVADAALTLEVVLAADTWARSRAAELVSADREPTR